MVVWKNPPKGRVLVLAPHPDDETIGCGGALALHRRQGDPVKVVFLTDGAKGDPDGHYEKSGYRGLRRREARAAARMLGVASLEFWDYPDRGLARAKDLPERLSALLEAYRPALVYRPQAEDPHPDHRALARRAERALGAHPRPVIDCRYEVWGRLAPTHLLDISRAWEAKLAAVRRYRSQLRYHDYARQASLLNGARGLLLRRCRYAEAYEVS